jgi:hypothetical protein
MAHCGARTQDGTPCKNTVKRPGTRCHKHPGWPTARLASPNSRQQRQRATTTNRRNASSPDRRQAVTPPQRRPAPTIAEAVAAGRERQLRERRKRERVEEAARFCSDVLTASWQNAVAGRVAGYANKATRLQLVRRRPSRQCKALAEFAFAILTGKQKSHDLVGRSAGWLVSRLGANEVAQVFARELASKLPLPYDAKLIAVARGLQVTGILLCVVDGRDLTRCPCFIDLALAESKAHLKKILVAALDNWTGLAAFPPSNRTRTVNS